MSVKLIKSSLVFNLFIIVSLQYWNVEPLNPPQCYSVHDKKGECVTFDMCPPLKELLKSNPVTQEKLRILQRLTCGFDKDQPKICCPLTEIVREANINNAGFQTNSQDRLKPESGQHQSKPGPTKNPLTEGPETIDRFQGMNSGLNYIAHPNFNLLPGLKDCSNPVNSARIVGGRDSALASFPWMARIGYTNQETNDVEFYCGGTVISKRYILTAAHCTEEIDEGFTPSTIRVGEHDTSTKEDCDPYVGCAKYQDYKIEKIIPHSGYSSDDKSNDIELIRVTEDISFVPFSVRPICLPFPKEHGVFDVWQKTFKEGKSKGWVVGWGRTKWNQAEGSDILQEVQLPLITNNECQFNYSTRVQITDKQLCSGGVKGQDSCGGDSGGPLMVPIPVNNEGKFFQLGVVSFGPVQCGVAGLPGVYSRVSAYLGWILDNLRR